MQQNAFGRKIIDCNNTSTSGARDKVLRTVVVSGSSTVEQQSSKAVDQQSKRAAGVGGCFPRVRSHGSSTVSGFICQSAGPWRRILTESDVKTHQGVVLESVKALSKDLIRSSQSRFQGLRAFKSRDGSSLKAFTGRAACQGWSQKGLKSLVRECEPRT